MNAAQYLEGLKHKHGESELPRKLSCLLRLLLVAQEKHVTIGLRFQVLLLPFTILYTFMAMAEMFKILS